MNSAQLLIFSSTRQTTMHVPYIMMQNEKEVKIALLVEFRLTRVSLKIHPTFKDWC